MPEVTRIVCGFRLTQNAGKHAFELAWIKKQAFAGRAEIKLGIFDNDCLEMASAAARTLAATRAKIQLVHGVECFGDTVRVFAGSQQAVQRLAVNPGTGAGRAMVYRHFVVSGAIEAAITFRTFHLA
jgi:hypothetical protein